MKAYVFLHVVYLILAKPNAAETVTKCESKVELRAVLLSCPTRDTGCDDDDPLSRAMAAEEAQIFLTNPKSFRPVKEVKERGYANAVKDCKRKLIITLKIKNSGKIPCDDEYIVVDHVFDPLTGGRGRLLTPVVLKLRQEQMIQLYGLQFQRVVNNDPFEEQKDTDKVCSVDPDNPTCGIAMYDGKPIPFSEGFCCSCSPDLNTKRQLSTVAHGDSFLYRDAKLISQKNNRFSPRSGSHSDGIKVRCEVTGATGERDADDDKDESCPVRGLKPDTVPNYLMENDRKIVCGKEDFLSELCRMRDEKNGDDQVPGYNLGLRGKTTTKEEPGQRQDGRKLTSSGTEDAVVPVVSLNAADDNDPKSNNLNNVVIVKDLIGALGMSLNPKGDFHSSKVNQVTRGKRENLREPTFSEGEKTADEKLNRYMNSKKRLRGRRKRLFDLSHNRFRQAQVRCRDAEECQKEAPRFPNNNCVKSPPPKYFFAHDKSIVFPGGTEQSTDNSSCKSTDESTDYDDASGSVRQKFVTNSNEDGTKTAKTDEEDKMSDETSAGRYQQRQRDDPMSSSRNERLKTRLDGNVLKGRDETADSLQDKTAKGSEEKLNVCGDSGGLKTDQSESRSKQDNVEKAHDDRERNQKSHFNGKNIKNYLFRTDEEKNAVKDKLKSSMVGKNHDRHKVSFQTSKSHNKLLSENGKHESDNSETGAHQQETHNGDFRVNSDEMNGRNALKSQVRDREKSKHAQENDEEPGDDQQQDVDAVKYEPATKQQQQQRQQEENKLKQFLEDYERLKSGDGNAFGDQRKYLKNDKQGMRHRYYRPGRPVDSDEGNVDFNFEIIRKPIQEFYVPRPVKIKDHLKNRPVDLSENDGPGYNFQRMSPPVVKPHEHPMLRYQNPQAFYLANNNNNNDRVKTRQDLHFRPGVVKFPSEVRGRQYFANLPQVQSQLHWAFGRPTMVKNYNAPSYKSKPSNYKLLQNDLSKIQKTRPNYLTDPAKCDGLHNVGDGGEFFGKRQYTRQNGMAQNRYSGANGNVGRKEVQNFRRARVKRSSEYDFEPAKGFLKSELDPVRRSTSGKSVQTVHELESCSAQRTTNGATGNDRSSSKPGEDDKLTIDLSTEALSQMRTFRGNATVPDGGTRPRRVLSDRERLLRSYATAPDYVISRMKMSLKDKRETGDSDDDAKDTSRMPRGCDSGGDDTAHCMRFGDLWYSVYMIKRPVVAQIVGLQMFDKHTLCDGTTEWRDLTKGKMIRIGTFLPKAEDELPTISMTFLGGKTKKAPSAINPDNYLLLIPSHMANSQSEYSPQLDGGPEEYLVVESKDVSSGGDCNMVGTSFEAFARQPDRCSRPRGSCLKRQPVDLWREDMEARIRGKRGKYFVENFGTVPNSPIKTYTNLTGEFLGLEYYGEYTSTIEIEVKADFNALVRKGSTAQIPSVYIDGTSPKKARIILSVLNIGLTSSFFRPRLGDCPPDLDPAWCPLEGPLVTIPPQQRHDFKLDLSGILPPNKIHVTGT